MKPIFLTGFMGSGKSTVGRRVALNIGLPFIDTDDSFFQILGFSVPVYIRRFGVEAFRRREKKILREVAARTPAVVATGGGIVLDPDNRHFMKREGTVVWLETPLPMLLSRLGAKNIRPLLPRPFSMQALKNLYQERLPYYRQCHHRIQNGFKTPEEVAKEIVQILQNG